MKYALIGLLLSAAAVTTVGSAPASDPSYPAELLSGRSHPVSHKGHAHGLPATAFATKAPVSLSWRIAERPRLGAPVPINLDFQALTGLSATVSVSGEEGLEVLSSDFEIAYRARNEHWSAQVLVTPTLASKRYLNIVVSTVDDAGQRRMRGFAVPVVVDPGAVRGKRQGPVGTDAHGVAVVSMPARQEVRKAP